jgi:CheY-like chemotaxis protein
VLVNLLTNAHHAMRKREGTKRITVRTRADARGGQIRLEVADTGPGIPPEIQEKVFEPFFTTKPAGEGTGLGLSLCRNIIGQHSGTLTLTSTPGRGTTFLIELPSSRLVVAAPQPVESDATPVAAKTILVVDDETEIAAVMSEMLQRDGHKTHVVANGRAALELLSQRSYDLVISDTKMPELDGVGLYREIERRFPAMRGRVLFVTGDVLDHEKQQFLESTHATVITKPFNLGDVRAAVRRRLAEIDGLR